MKFLVILSILAGLASPLLQRYGRARSWVLAAVAALLIVMAGVGLCFPDLREGLAAVEANRKEYRFVLTCEIPALALGLVSLGWLKKLTFWLGWAIHAAFTAFVMAVVIWLEFFWHW